MRLLRRVVTGGCAALGLLVVFVTFTPFVSWYGGVLAGPWNGPTGDTLIVLGAGSLDQGFPSQGTMLRCLYAVRVYQAGGFRRIVLTGFPIADHMRRLMIAEGIPAEAVQVENASESTHENALYTAASLAGDHGSKVLLTSDYHMFRAVRAFRKAGINVLPLPIPDVRKRATGVLGRWPAFLDEAVESCKIVYYFLHGWI